MTAVNKTSLPARQDQLLPTEVSMRSSTWFDRSSSYPIFSGTWYRYRVISALVSMVLMLVIFLLIAFASRDQWKSVVVPGASLGLGMLCLLTSGIGMAVLVRRQGWPVRKEAIGLVTALLLGLLLSWGVVSGSGTLARMLVYGSASSEVSIALTGNIREVKKDEAEKAEKVDGEGKTAKAAAPADSSPAVEVGPGVGEPSPAEVSAASSSSTAASARSSSSGDAGSEGRNKENTDNTENKDKERKNMWGTVAGVLGVSAFVLHFGGWMDLFLFFRQRRRLEEVLRQQEMDRLKAARNEAELRLSVLVAQVEPHFLFNTLAGVRSAIVTEPQRATAIVDHLVDYLRATIPQMRSDGSSAQARLGPQLEAARAYLALMQARIPRLSYSVESDVDMQDAAIPPLILISLVENAVKHGIEPKIGAARIAIRAREIEVGGVQSLELSVSDDGVGFGGTTSGSGLGLSNIRERLETLYGEQASLTLKALPEGGVAAIILLPLSA
ncbi:sensor histidine kinase [Undibacterium terreum]|uniref:Histidine kinase/HSP90-like ATPase domain-containing protein n=1 Tax=Undibacterium terreum TaxID=1224302 RepID=A0A916V0K0_9BURK|nr:histidine kinase [Undibacterium terreum]GGC96473.1 hypothetical protein GCM10011396_49860 [Undibacterium terreum]